MSDERISVGRKWRRAKVDLPEPDAPIRTIIANSGTAIRRPSVEAVPALIA
jgi:hypothetical protein